MTEYINLAVCGQHMKGGCLHYQLEKLGARFVSCTTTSANYKLFKLTTIPIKPGLVRVVKGGQKIEVEVYCLDATSFGKFIDAIPAPLGFAKVELADGALVTGFVVEPYAVFNSDGTLAKGVEEITDVGSFRRYLSQ